MSRQSDIDAREDALIQKTVTAIVEHVAWSRPDLAPPDVLRAAARLFYGMGKMCDEAEIERLEATEQPTKENADE